MAATLDLGTGCGIQALLSAKHSERVVATDVNARALAFARFNAALNGIDSIEFRHGDLFEPVDGERFGLVVANPPYVISPDSAVRVPRRRAPSDEPPPRAIVETCPAISSRGRVRAHPRQLGAFARRRGTSGPSRSRNGCTEPPAMPGSCTTGRTTRSRMPRAGCAPVARSSPEEYEAAVERWLEYLRRLEIEAIGYGAVVLRRRSVCPTGCGPTSYPSTG